MIEFIASTHPSDLFFAIAEQINALMGLLLCLIMAWDHMPNPHRKSALLAAVGLVWFVSCGVFCHCTGLASTWTVLPTAVIIAAILGRISDLPLPQVLIVVSTAAYIVAAVYYLALLTDVAALGARSTDQRVGWPGWTALLLMDIIVPVSLWHPLHVSIPKTFGSPAVDGRFWNFIWLFPFISAAIAVWCLPVDNDTLLMNRMLGIAFTIDIAYSCFMALAYALIWYMIRQSERLLLASRKEHYADVQTLQLQHMNERIHEARAIKHNVRHHIQTLQALAAADDMDGIRDYLGQMAEHPLLNPAPMQYCDHAALNAVLVYYCDWIRHKGADVDVKASVPQYIAINNAELCSLVGNLLENACEAISRQQEGPRSLKARIRYHDGPPASLFIVVDNSYDSSVTQVDDAFASTKHSGNGLGTATIRETAERHHGTAAFDYDGDTFRASVMLCLPD